MTRYVVVGAGAVGVTLAAELARVGRDVVLVGRGRQLDLLRQRRLTYIRPSGSYHPELAVAAGADEVRLDRGDVLVVATKTPQVADVIAEWAGRPVGDRLAGDVLPVVTLQNGLDAERTALRRFAHVIGAVLLIPATYVNDGEVVSPAAPASGIFYLGAYPDGPPSPTTHTVATDLKAAGFEVQLVDELSRWKAAKLAVSVTFVLDALYPPGPERDRAARLVEQETREILLEAGYEPADFGPDSTVDFSRFVVHHLAGHERGGSSTWQSLARNGRPETDFLNGEVVLLARQLGRRAPVNAALVQRIHRAVTAGTPAGSLPTDDLAETLAAVTIVDAATLAIELDSAEPPALLDVRWALGDQDREKHYLDAHLPGAVYVDLETELASTPTPEHGRHPLPAPSDLLAAARRWGLRSGRPVVVYDDNGGQSAARAWWLLRWAGHSDVRILDGGLGAWIASGGALESSAVHPEPGDVELVAGRLPTTDAGQVDRRPARTVLVDARAAERYRGEVEPVDPRAGHIPGAISLPTAGNLGADSRFRPVAELRQRFRDAGLAGPEVDEVVVYCGSGVTAAHEVAALHAAGIDAVLFPGSWSAWSSDPDRPIAVGAEPS